MIDDENVSYVLYAEDDEEDRMLFEDAVKEIDPTFQVKFVNDGVELLDFLRAKTKKVTADRSILPRLILLDLNMPRMDGREVLKVIKNDLILKLIPIVILTTSNAKQDISFSYDFGAASYIKKPATFSMLLDILNTIKNYWFHIVEVPVIQYE